MENASKALLIVAAILIVIILVAVGVKVLNSISGSKDAAITIGESISATAFNSRIKRYAGANKSANEVVELLDIVLANNEKENRKIYISERQINVDGEYLRISDRNASSEQIQRDKEKIKAHKKVNVYVYYDSDGYIRAIGYQYSGLFEYKADYNSQIGG